MDRKGKKTGEDLARPKVKLIGEDGNAFFMIGRCRRAAKKAGWTEEQLDRVTKEMIAGNYDHLLATVQKYFDVE